MFTNCIYFCDMQRTNPNNSILISQCGDAMEKVTVAMAATRKIVQLLTVSEER